MKLDSLKFGLALGIIWAACVLFLGIADALWGWGGGLVKGIGSLYIGFKPSPGGALIGLVWAFFDGGIGGLIFAALYNCLVGFGKK